MENNDHETKPPNTQQGGKLWPKFHWFVHHFETALQVGGAMLVVGGFLMVCLRNFLTAELKKSVHEVYLVTTNIKSQVASISAWDNRNAELRKTLHDVYDGTTNLNSQVASISSLDNRIQEIYRLEKKSDDRLAQLNIWVNDRYPDDGIIATFPTSANPAISTATKQQFSLLSDSAFGACSTIRYERISHDLLKQDGDGFLRIHYHLLPNSSSQGSAYVGIFADFANPTRMFDLTKFSSIALRLRLANTNGPACHYYVQLCDANVAAQNSYAWAEIEIPSSAITTASFVPFQQSLKSFQTPLWSEQKFLFDPARVFAIILSIKSAERAASDGYLDIDEIVLK